MRLPVFTSLRGYQKSWLSGDVLAGLTVWAIIVPESLAYATIAGVSPVVGLYAAPLALVVYAALGSSKHLIVGPMASTATLSAAALAQIGGNVDPATATAAIALMTGVIALLAGLLRFGFLANLISQPVMKGFIVGLALFIMVGQLPKLFGIEDASGSFFQKLWATITNLGSTNPVTLAVGLASLAIVLVLRRLSPRIPAALVAAALAIVAVTVFNLDESGVAVMGPIASGLPAVSFPSLPLPVYMKAAAAAAAIVLVGFVEGLGAAQTYANRNHYEVDPNRELVGFGAANIATGFASGMVTNGSLSKTAVNGGAGAKSEVSGLVAAGLTILTLLFLTGLFQNLPEATLAAIVIVALFDLVDFRAIADLYRVHSSRLGRIYGPVASRPDFVGAAVAMSGVLVIGMLPGLLIGIMVSMLLLLYRTSRPHVARLGNVPGTRQYADVAQHAENVTRPDVVVLRIESGLYFANAEVVRQRIQSSATDNRVRVVVLDLETVPTVDVTAARMLAELAADLDRRRISMVFARETAQVRDVLESTDGARQAIPLYASVRAAVEASARRAAPRARDDHRPLQ